MFDAAVIDREEKGKNMMKSKIRRNVKCHCGSGKKYKKCCLESDVSNTSTSKELRFNIGLNRHESLNEHKYIYPDHTPVKYYGDNDLPHLGKIKCKLVHQDGNTIITPDYLFYDNGWIQPLNFTAPLISMFDENLILCRFFIGIQNGVTVTIEFSNTDFLTTLPDKSQLFNCKIYGPENFNEYKSGEIEEFDGNIFLKLYHHTNSKGFNGILSTQSLWSSKWNYKGNKECINTNFVYFTHIPLIKYHEDLATVAMSKDGNLHLATDTFTPPSKNLTIEDLDKYNKFLYTAEVYKADLIERNKTIEFHLPVHILDSKHLYKHTQHMIFYEICFSYIHRVRVNSKSTLTFNPDKKIIEDSNVIVGDYLIIGDATNKDGLAAPFEEEETEYIGKIEHCGAQNLLDFWISYPNKDLFSAKEISSMQMRTVSNNPTIKK